MSTNNGKEFEELIAMVEEAVHNLPNVKVLHNVKLPTKYDGERQIDILIEEERGRFTYRTIIECKNTRSKISVNVVGAFKELLESVGAHQGIIVSTSAFQKGALLSAQKENIFLYQFSQFAELTEHLKNIRLNISNLEHVSKEFTVRFKEKKSINDKVTIHKELFSIKYNHKTSILKLMEEFLAQSRQSITDHMISMIKDPSKVQVIEGDTEIKVDLTEPLIFADGSEQTEITGFETILNTTFFTSPTSIKNIAEYKDVRNNKVHAQVMEVEFGGVEFKVLRKVIK